MHSVVCINGPNLDRLGTRDPAVYGDWTLARLEERVTDWGERLGIAVTCLQSNHEGAVVEAIHAAAGADGVVLNAGALTHSSPAVGDAVEACPAPVVEVHLSNIRRRERWRNPSYVTGPAVRSIVGRGPDGYRAALRHLVNRWAGPFDTLRYGPHPDQVIDLRRPDGATVGAVLLHGGLWSDVWGSDTVESWAVDLAARGIATANLEYRRVGSGGGALPTTSDVRLGLRAGVEALGVDRFALVGHSAGAHLAVWDTIGSPAPPVIVVAISGIFDLEQAAKIGEGAAARFDPTSSTTLLGAGRPGAPMALVHGTDDRVVPVDQSVSYTRYLETVGAGVTLDRVDSSHFEALNADSSAWSVGAARLTAALA